MPPLNPPNQSSQVSPSNLDSHLPNLPLNRPIKVFILGYGYLGNALLKGVLNSPDCELVGVFRWSTHPKHKVFASQPEEKNFIKSLRKAKVKEFVTPGVNSYEFTQVLEMLKPDVVLIGSWGEILKSHLLNYPGIQMINCHPSFLPAHRGANPYASVICSGTSVTGVTFHQAVQQIDAGPIYYQEQVEVYLEDTGAELRERCAKKTEEMVPTLVEMLVGKRPLQLISQDERFQSYFGSLKVEYGALHWQRSPEELYNQVRGLQPWLDCYSFLHAKWLTTFSKVQYRQQDLTQQALPPGTVVAFEKGVIWVSTTNPVIQLGLSQFKLYIGQFLIPKALTSYLGRFLIRPGMYFRTT